MKIAKSKLTAIAFALLLIFSMTASLILLPTTNALAPGKINIPTYAFISVSPNPIGLGQQVNVNFWINEPPPTASAQYGDRWGNMTVIVTLPDKSTIKLGPFTSDDTGGTHTTYTPAATGNYTFQMTFPGQILANANPPPGGPGIFGPNALVGDYYQPSTSDVFTLTVQENPIASAPVTPLPSSYWTRPIYGENNEWYTIGGNWLGFGTSTFAATGMYNSSANYNAYTQAPNTGHILWTKPEAFGGIVGGEAGGTETGNYYSTSQYEPKFAPIIMNGILYYTMYPGSSTYPTGWAAVDLRTGQTLWTKNETNLVLRCGQILQEVTPNQYGSLAYLWGEPLSASGFMAAGASLEMFDAMTGAYVLTVTNTPAMTLVEDTHGDLCGYYVNTTGFSQSLSMWNSTRAINLEVGNYGGGPNVADDWMWRPPLGAQIPFNLGVQWSAPLVKTINGSPLVNYATGLFGLGIYGVEGNTVLMDESNIGFSAFLYQPGWQIEDAYSAVNGAHLWTTPVNRTETPFSIVYSGSTWMGSGVYVELTESTLSITAYSLSTGKLAWGPVTLPNASPFSSLGANDVVANGTIYIWLYGGDVYAYNLADGSLKWQYHTPTGGYESPYGVEPLWTFTVGSVADGKLFVPEGHMYSPPLFHGAQQLALNITNGKVVWGIDAFDVTSAPAVADGIMTTLNAYDNQIYGYGKGPSQISVTAPGSSDSTGVPVVIRGTITDISAGTKQQAQAADFPNGVPCVSDGNMSVWMQYVYMQQEKPTNVVGVPITLTAIDSNNNTRTIGQATSDASGMFTYAWTPDIAGSYTITATFAGSQSYFGSSAETSYYATSPHATASPVPVQVNLQLELTSLIAQSP